MIRQPRLTRDDIQAIVFAINMHILEVKDADTEKMPKAGLDYIQKYIDLRDRLEEWVMRTRPAK